MRLSRRAARQAPPPDDGALESWITDLTEGEPSVRRFRERLAAAGAEPGGTCAACRRAADHAEHHGSDGDGSDHDQHRTAQLTA